MKCRHCGQPLQHTFLDLGFAPPSNAYLTQADLNRPEKYFPLKVWVCDQCWLVQTEDYTEADELFNADYAYFSSTSESWLRHARQYAIEMQSRLALGKDSFVIEVASNDGYLLKNFIDMQVPCLGIEPTASTASAAEQLGIPVWREFFGENLAQKLAAAGKQADLIVGNNVYAHVPDINDFTRGLKAALKPGGTITLEFPHLLQLVRHAQFDTIYHEHFSYLSLTTVKEIFESAELRIHDVETLDTHGGSLRVFGSHANDSRPCSAEVESMLKLELSHGLLQLNSYAAFQARAERIKIELLAFLVAQKKAGKTVMAYGAAAKGNTLLNYAGVKPDLLPLIADAAPSKQGKFMPGSHIPIGRPEDLISAQPDFVLILPWNISAEITAQIGNQLPPGVQFVCAVPELRML